MLQKSADDVVRYVRGDALHKLFFRCCAQLHAHVVTLGVVLPVRAQRCRVTVNGEHHQMSRLTTAFRPTAYAARICGR